VIVDEETTTTPEDTNIAHGETTTTTYDAVTMGDTTTAVTTADVEGTMAVTTTSSESVTVHSFAPTEATSDSPATTAANCSGRLPTKHRYLACILSLVVHGCTRLSTGI